MHAELIDSLRCPRPHEDSWLVAVAERTEERDIVRGTLGCPVCQAEYLIERGAVRFAEPTAIEAEPASDERAMRLAAFLELTAPATLALLTGAWGSQAAGVEAISPSRMILLDPPAALEGHGLSVVYAPGTVPLAANAVNGVAIAATHGGVAPELVRALKTGGRMLGLAAVPVPAGVREIARDEEMWVGVKEVDGGIVVPLRRRPE